MTVNDGAVRSSMENRLDKQTSSKAVYFLCIAKGSSQPILEAPSLTFSLIRDFFVVVVTPHANTGHGSLEGKKRLLWHRYNIIQMLSYVLTDLKITSQNSG